MPNNRQELQKQLSLEFSPQSFPIQIEIINGNPWFLAKDVCDILGLQNPTDILSKMLDEDEKLTYTIDRAGQARNMNFVNESGLYNLIFRSSKPEAKRFRKWVTSEVLPSIRKTGSYGKYSKATPQNIDSLLPYVDQLEHKGQKLYAAKQLMILLGKSVNGRTDSKIALLEKEKLAYKLTGGDSGQTKWYIRRAAIGRLLNIRPNTLARIEIIKQLKQGGLL